MIYSYIANINPFLLILPWVKRNQSFYSTLEANKLNDKQLGPYLAGLIEGDGSIYTPLISEDSKTNTVPHIEITFDVKDSEFFKKIKNVLGGGFITMRSNGQSGRLRLCRRKKDILLKLVNLINGHMRTPKIEALHRLINFLNLKHNYSIPLCGIDQTPLSESSWLFNSWFFYFLNSIPHVRKFHTNNLLNLSPYFVTGFALFFLNLWFKKNQQNLHSLYLLLKPMT